MSSATGLSRIVWSTEGEQLFSFEVSAHLSETSVTLIEHYIALGLIEPRGMMLRQEEIIRIGKLSRLRRDLGLNLVGAAMVLDMAEEINRLKAQLRAYRSTD